MRKRIFNLAVKPAVIISLTILFLVIIVGHFSRILQASEFFKIKEIIIAKSNQADLSYLKGKNIFTVDLKKESRYILESYPDYRKIWLVRIFPNRLYADFKRRIPLACVRLYRNFYVDDDLVLFDIPGGSEIQDLPVIVGLETKIFGPRPGKKQEIKELALALSIIKEIERNKALKDYKIKKIDVSGLDSASFFMLLPPSYLNSARPQFNPVPAILEVKIGQGNIADKVNVLASLLAQMKKDSVNLKYIDLRFKEPVIRLSAGPK